jgi:hypothetical protein
MKKLLIIALLSIVIQLNLIESSDLKIDCNLVKNNDVKDSIICNLNTKNLTNKYKYKFLKNASYANSISFTNALPFEVDSKTSNLVWLNKYQPQAIRWSEVCPSNYLVSTYQQNINLCLNPTCDLTGICTIKYEQINQVTNKSSTLTINLKDNINSELNDNKPMFSTDLRFINITFDLESFDEFSNNEILLIESTDKLDPYRSKINRIRNEFDFDLIKFDEQSENDNDQDESSASFLYKKYCRTTLSHKLDPFSIRYDIESEKLYIKYRFNRNDFKLNQQHSCFLYRLSIKRPQQLINTLSSSIVLVNLFDNRFDKPVFDFQVYNFTVDENSPLNSLIGKVNAVYLNRDDPSSINQIKYKIVPFDANFDIDQILDSDESLLNNRLQIKVDSKTGILSQKSNIDREKHILTGIMDYEKASPSLVNYMSKSKLSNKQSADMGLIKFNIEASYESMTYGYSKVNIFIRDVNDNPPIAKIRPLANYVRSNLNKQSSLQSSSNEITNLYVTENTAINQILAYVGVNDPDAGENGTIKSIDLTLINYRKPSNQTLKQREMKYEQLKKFHHSISPLKNRNDFGYEKITCLLQQYDKQVKLTSFQFQQQQQQQPQIPFKLNKINDKLYTIQLITKLDFKNYESYSVEMRIQDNGTRPQLESKTRINLNVLDQNDNYPIFLNLRNKIKIIENKYDNDAVLKEDSEKLEWPIIFKANAIDLDDDYNGLIKYSLLNNPFLIDNFTSVEEAKILLESTFSLNKDTGDLKLLRSINSENLYKNQIDLIIMAIDQSDTQKLNKTIKVTIEIIDVNNNQPIFDSEKYSFKFNFDQIRLNNQLEWSNYKQIASTIYLTDLDSFETNSKEFINENLSKASSIIKTAFLNDIMTDSAQIIKPKFLFNDKKCFKTFNVNLIDASSNSYILNSLIFYVELDEQSNKLYTNRVTCKMSIWLDLNKFKLSVFNETNKININFDLQLEDFGLKNETFKNKAGDMISKSNFNIELNNNPSENDALIFQKSYNKTNDNKYLIEQSELDLFDAQKLNKDSNTYIVLNEFEIQTECEIKSINKLDRYLNDSNKFETIDSMEKIKLIKSSNELNKYKIVYEKNDKSFIMKKILGVYLIDLYLISNSNVKTLKKIEMILYNNNKRNLTHSSGITMLNEYNKEFDSFLMNDNQLISKSNSDNSMIDSSFIQFQNLLFGTSNNNNNQDEASFLFSQNGLLNGLFLNNRSTFIQIIIISLIISVTVLATLICCIILLIKRNCSKSSNNHKKGNKKSSSNKSTKKTINVVDDESITTGSSESKKFDDLNNSNEENGGFITRIIQMDEANEKKILRLGLDNPKEKVNRYLDGLNGYEKQVIIVSAEQNPSSSSSSPTSSSSIVDSKKNLIIPVDMYDNKSSFKYSSNNNVNKNDKLSTTSSSCISDEGCYGSSDFSSESNNKLVSANKNLKSILINSNSNNNSNRNQPPISIPQSIRQQKNYCINNLTRFEKIYNNKNDLDLSLNNENKISSSTFKSGIKSSTVNSPAISLNSNLNQQNNVQVITSISGSYV